VEAITHNTSIGSTKPLYKSYYYADIGECTKLTANVNYHNITLRCYF